MKRTLIISLLVGMMGVMAFSGCDSTGATFRPNDELFEYTCYAKGSYWVYEDSATHEIDSLIVITEPEKTRTGDEPCHGSTSGVKTFSHKYIYVNRNNSINDTLGYMPTVHGDFRYANDSRLHKNIDEGLLPEDCYYLPNVRTTWITQTMEDVNARIEYAFLYNNTPKPTLYDQYYRIYQNLPCYIAYFPSYSVGNKEYNYVKKFMYEKISYNQHTTIDTIYTYWAKNIGVIRWECHDSIGSTIMNLVRYDVKNIGEKDLEGSKYKYRDLN